MSRIIGLIVLILLFQGCMKDEIKKPSMLNCPLEVASIYKVNPKSNYYQALIDRYVSYGLPGVSLLIKDDDGFYIGSAGKADISGDIPMQPCHISKIASITKMMMGTAILRLQEKGVLSLNDPVSKYIPQSILGKISNGDEPLTIRNLLNHTAGLYDVIDDDGFYLQVLNDPSRQWTADDLLEFVYEKDAAFAFNPAEKVGYSNTNYLLLSMIVEAATGTPHSEILHHEVIDPLGLTDTYYYWHDPLPETGIAQGYFDLYNNGNLENLTQWNTGSGNGYGGIYSTVWDMYVYADALFIKKTLLSQASLDQMLVFHPVIESRKQIGVGCFKDFIDIGNPELDYAWGHRGRDLCYSADLFYFPEHNAIMSLIVNYGTDGNSSLRTEFLEMRDEIAKIIIQN
ncbi:MAG: serine hydrolase domain-containing protein [Lentimicrobiaceae bacterium]